MFKRPPSHMALWTSIKYFNRSEVFTNAMVKIVEGHYVIELMTVEQTYSCWFSISKTRWTRLVIAVYYLLSKYFPCRRLSLPQSAFFTTNASNVIQCVIYKYSKKGILDYYQLLASRQIVGSV